MAVSKLLGKALADNRYDYIPALYLARYAGLRIHECLRIDTATAEQALWENIITIKGKGGKARTVPIEDKRVPMMLRKLLEQADCGQKLLVPDDPPTDRAINRLQLFILRYREEIQTEDTRHLMTFHGLRHTYRKSTKS